MVCLLIPRDRLLCIVHLALENAAVVSLMTWIRFCKLHSLSWCQQQAARKKINKWEAKQKINVVFTQTIVTYKMANHCFVYSFVSMANDTWGEINTKPVLLVWNHFVVNCHMFAAQLAKWWSDQVSWNLLVFSYCPQMRVLFSKFQCNFKR